MKAVFGIGLGCVLACAVQAQVAGDRRAAFTDGMDADAARAEDAAWGSGAGPGLRTAVTVLGTSLVVGGTLTAAAGFVGGVAAWDPEASARGAKITLGGLTVAGLGIGILMWGPGDGWNLMDHRVTLRLHPSGRGGGLDVRF